MISNNSNINNNNSNINKSSNNSTQKRIQTAGYKRINNTSNINIHKNTN